MGRYSALVGKRVEAHYRAGDLHLSACGTLVIEAAKAVVLEERFTRNGREKNIRIEIPYEYLLRLREPPRKAEEASATSVHQTTT
jgi:hypothetical protein